MKSFTEIVYTSSDSSRIVEKVDLLVPGANANTTEVEPKTGLDFANLYEQLEATVDQPNVYFINHSEVIGRVIPTSSGGFFAIRHNMPWNKGIDSRGSEEHRIVGVQDKRSFRDLKKELEQLEANPTTLLPTGYKLDKITTSKRTDKPDDDETYVTMKVTKESTTPGVPEQQIIFVYKRRNRKFEGTDKIVGRDESRPRLWILTDDPAEIAKSDGPLAELQDHFKANGLVRLAKLVTGDDKNARQVREGALYARLHLQAEYERQVAEKEAAKFAKDLEDARLQLQNTNPALAAQVQTLQREKVILEKQLQAAQVLATTNAQEVIRLKADVKANQDSLDALATTDDKVKRIQDLEAKVTQLEAQLKLRQAVADAIKMDKTVLTNDTRQIKQQVSSETEYRDIPEDQKVLTEEWYTALTKVLKANGVDLAKDPQAILLMAKFVDILSKGEQARLDIGSRSKEALVAEAMKSVIAIQKAARQAGSELERAKAPKDTEIEHKKTEQVADVFADLEARLTKIVTDSVGSAKTPRAEIPPQKADEIAEIYKQIAELKRQREQIINQQIQNMTVNAAPQAVAQMGAMPCFVGCAGMYGQQFVPMMPAYPYSMMNMAPMFTGREVANIPPAQVNPALNQAAAAAMYQNAMLGIQQQYIGGSPELAALDAQRSGLEAILAARLKESTQSGQPIDAQKLAKDLTQAIAEAVKANPALAQQAKDSERAVATAIATMTGEASSEIAKLYEAQSAAMLKMIEKLSGTNPEIARLLEQQQQSQEQMMKLIKSLTDQEITRKVELKEPAPKPETLNQLQARLTKAESELLGAKEALEGLKKVEAIKGFIDYKATLLSVLPNDKDAIEAAKTPQDILKFVQKASSLLRTKITDTTPQDQLVNLVYQISQLSTIETLLLDPKPTTPENATVQAFVTAIPQNVVATNGKPYASNYVNALRTDIPAVAKELKIDMAETKISEFVAKLDQRKADLIAKGASADRIKALESQIASIKAAIAARGAEAGQPAGQSTLAPTTEQPTPAAAGAEQPATPLAEGEQPPTTEEELRSEIKEIQVSQNIADLEASMLAAESYLSKKPEKVAGWKRWLRTGAEILTGALGGSVGRAVIGGLVTAGMVGAGVATAGLGGIAIAAVTGAVGGGVASGLFSSLAHYRLFHKEKHAIASEYAIKGNNVLAAFKNAGHEKIMYGTYHLDERLGNLGNVYNKLAMVDLSNPNAYTLESLNAAGISTDEITQAFQHLYYVRELTNFVGLNGIRLPEGIKLNGVDNIQDALNRLVVQIPAIIDQNKQVLSAEDLIKNAQKEVDTDYKKALWVATRNKAFKGAVIGGISGAVLQMVQNVQESGNILGEIRGNSAELMDVKAAAEANQDAANQLTEVYGQSKELQTDNIAKLATEIGKSPEELMKYAGSDGVFNTQELAELQKALGGAGKLVDKIIFSPDTRTLPVKDLPDAWKEGLARIGVKETQTLHFGASGNGWGEAQGKALEALQSGGYDVTGAEGFKAWAVLSRDFVDGNTTDVAQLAERFGLSTGGTTELSDSAKGIFATLGESSAKFTASKEHFDKILEETSKILASGGKTAEAVADGGKNIFEQAGQKLSDVAGNVRENGPEFITNIGNLPGKIGAGAVETFNNRGTILANIESGLKNFGNNVQMFFTGPQFTNNLEQTAVWLGGALMLQAPISFIGSGLGYGGNESGYNPRSVKAGEKIQARVFTGGTTPTGVAAQTTGPLGAGQTTQGQPAVVRPNTGTQPAGSQPAGAQTVAGARQQTTAANYRGTNFRTEATNLGDESKPRAWKSVLISPTIEGTNLNPKDVAESSKYRDGSLFESKEAKAQQTAAYRQLVEILASGMNGSIGIPLTIKGKTESFTLNNTGNEELRKKAKIAAGHAADRMVANLGDTVDELIAQELKDMGNDPQLSQLKQFKNAEVFGTDMSSRGFAEGIYRILRNWKDTQTPYSIIRDVMVLTTYLSDANIDDAKKDALIQGYLDGIDKLPNVGGASIALNARTKRGNTPNKAIAFAALRVAVKAAGYEPALTEDGTTFQLAMDQGKKGVVKRSQRNVQRAQQELGKQMLGLDTQSKQAEVIARIQTANQKMEADRATQKRGGKGAGVGTDGVISQAMNEPEPEPVQQEVTFV